MDHAATTPLSKDALEAMMPYLTTDYGNASTVYTYGQRARAALERSRRTIAATIGAKPSEIYFTSGGTESDNWALIGAAETGKRGHIITDQIEHHAIYLLYLQRLQNTLSISIITSDNNNPVTEPLQLFSCSSDRCLILINTDQLSSV